MAVKERLIEFIKWSQGTDTPIITQFEEECKLGNNYVKGMRKSVGEKGLLAIKKKYPQLNEAWLLLGQGPMLLNQDQLSVMDTEKPAKEQTPSLDALILSNNLMAEAHLKQVENNTRLIALLERNASIEDEARRSQKDTDSTLTAIQKAIVDLGVKSGVYASEKDGQNILGKIVYDELTKGEAKRSPDGLGKPHK